MTDATDYLDYHDPRWDVLAFLLGKVRNLNEGRWGLRLGWDEILVGGETIEPYEILTGQQIEHAIAALRREVKELEN